MQRQNGVALRENSGIAQRLAALFGSFDDCYERVTNSSVNQPSLNGNTLFKSPEKRKRPATSSWEDIHSNAVREPRAPSRAENSKQCNAKRRASDTPPEHSASNHRDQSAKSRTGAEFEQMLNSFVLPQLLSPLNDSQSSGGPRCEVLSTGVEETRCPSSFASAPTETRVQLKLSLTSLPRERRQLLHSKWKAKKTASLLAKPDSDCERVHHAAAATGASKKQSLEVGLIGIQTPTSIARNDASPNVRSNCDIRRQKPPSKAESSVSPQCLQSAAAFGASQSEVALKPPEPSYPQSKFSISDTVEVQKRTIDGYGQAGRDIKHRGDKTEELAEKALLYLEAALYFTMSAFMHTWEAQPKGKANKGKEMAYKRLSGSLNFLKSSITSSYLNGGKPESEQARRLRRRIKLLVSLLDACLSYQLYALRSEEVYSNHLQLRERKKMELCITSAGSASERRGSTSSSSQPASEASPANSRPSSTSSRPEKGGGRDLQAPETHRLQEDQLQLLTHLMFAHKIWNEAHSALDGEAKDFLAALNQHCGEVKLDSGPEELIAFFGTAVKWLQQGLGNRVDRRQHS